MRCIHGSVGCVRETHRSISSDEHVRGPRRFTWSVDAYAIDDDLRSYFAAVESPFESIESFVTTIPWDRLRLNEGPVNSHRDVDAFE